MAKICLALFTIAIHGLWIPANPRFALPAGMTAIYFVSLFMLTAKSANAVKVSTHCLKNRSASALAMACKNS